MSVNKKTQSKSQDHIDLLGRTAVDKVTGLKGVITSISFELYGCVQAIVTPAADKENKRESGCWFDINRLTISNKKPVMQVPNFCSGYIAEGGQGGCDKPLT